MLHLLHLQTLLYQFQPWNTALGTRRRTWAITSFTANANLKIGQLASAVNDEMAHGGPLKQLAGANVV